jgi:hypothetical protein
VRWQAAEGLTPLCFSQWRTKATLGEVAKRHAKLFVEPLEETEIEYAREQLWFSLATLYQENISNDDC